MPIDPKLIPYPEQQEEKKRRRLIPLPWLARAIWGFLLVLLLAVVSFFFFFNTVGETFLEEKLSQTLNRPVQIEYLRVIVPFGLAADDVDVGGVIKIKAVKAWLDLPQLLNGKIHIAWLDLEEPVISLSRTKERRFVLGEPSAAISSPAVEPAPADSTQGVVPAPGRKEVLEIDSLTARKGVLHFTDLTTDKEFRISLEDVALLLQNFHFPWEDVNTSFEVRAGMLKSSLPLSGSNLAAQGWFNIPQKDLNADLRVAESDGRMALSAKAVSVANNLTVTGNIKVKDLTAGLAKPNVPAQKPFNFEQLVFNAIQSSGIEVDADFHFKTRMDAFEIGAVSFSGNLGYNVPKNLDPAAPEPAAEAPDVPSPAQAGPADKVIVNGE